MANQIAKSGPGASPTYYYCSSRYKSNEQNNSAQYGPVVFKLYSALKSWRGNCACWNKDSCDLSSDILIQLVQNLASKYAFLLNILGDFDVGVLGLQIKHRGTVEEATSLLCIFFLFFSPDLKKRKWKKNLPLNLLVHLGILIPLERQPCIVICYLYFTVGEFIMVSCEGRFGLKENLKTLDHCNWWDLSKQKKGMQLEGQTANFFILSTQSNVREGHRVTCYFIGQMWAYCGNNSSTLKSS